MTIHRLYAKRYRVLLSRPIPLNLEIEGQPTDDKVMRRRGFAATVDPIRLPKARLREAYGSERYGGPLQSQNCRISDPGGSPLLFAELPCRQQGLGS